VSTKIAFVSLGCDKNTVDSEIMIQLLAEKGYEIVKDDAQAEVIVVNTCGFIQDAKEESINTLIEMGEFKESGCLKALVATGCLAERYADEILQELPEVDAVVGTGSYEKIVDVVEELMQGKRAIQELADAGQRDLGYRKRVLLTPGYYGYVKIAEGCDNHCTYCVIPKLRGPFRSRKQEDILQEVQDMAREGVKELMIVAQDITKYGKDWDGQVHLSELLHKIGQVEGIEWIRLLYCYPEDITDELIQTIANEPKIVHYIDMPIQHCSDRVLRRMGRHHTKQQLIDVIGKLREAIPDIALRTTLITGFPGETQEEFEEMCEFVQEMRFDRLGVFAYSQEEDTPAAKMPDQVEEEEKQRRRDLLMEIQQQISSEKSAEMVGTQLDVMIEGQIPGEGDEDTLVYSARTYRDAPDIDGFLFLSSPKAYLSGDFTKAEVVGAYEYDLMGVDLDVEYSE
jgi:ribosomal protein S12 methylthiotransferase